MNSLEQQLKQLVRQSNNLNADGSVDWTNVTEMLLDDNPDMSYDEINQAVDDYTDNTQADFSADFTEWMEDDYSESTIEFGEVF